MNACSLSQLVSAALLAFSVIAARAGTLNPEEKTIDLTPLHDAERVLINPHKGWYHHFPDNHPEKYQIEQDSDLLDITGMDHLYIRLAWSYLEPREGQFNWDVIDRIIQKWTAHGLGIAFRISAKETSTDRPEQQFATPRWVMEAGAQGGYYRAGQPVGPDGPWEPVFDDPIFLAKLDRFLAAFAARYDRQPWVRYIDIGSIGDWGEGHTWAGSRKECGLAARKLHLDLHLKHFKHAPLVISDDFVYALSNPAERQALHHHILANGISYRDDSILVNGYLAGLSDQFTVRSPDFFADAYLHTPTVLELEHYSAVKRLGNWEGRPDSLVARYGKGKKGPDFFRGALQLLHATYIGYHGNARQWLADNPELTGELLNRCGYWLFPKAIRLPSVFQAGTSAALALTIENRGVAPPYAPIELRVKLSGPRDRLVRLLAQEVKSWRPGEPVVSNYTVPLPDNLPPGGYTLSIGLFDVASAKTRPVEFALKASARDAEGYYQLAMVNVTGKPPGEPSSQAPAAPQSKTVFVNADAPAAVAFAVREIRQALEGVPASRTSALQQISFHIDASLESQAYRFARPSANVLQVVGGDDAGAMYGGLDLAEAIRLNLVDQLTETIHLPFIAQRGLKFNIPLDLRTPSYSDNSDAAQANLPEMWSLAFWQEFLDEMARHRFNVLSLWSLNPFPSLVRVPEFPDAALPDVLRGRRDAFDEHFPHDGRNMFRPEFLKDAEMVKRMTIEEKVAFWREVLQMAKDRGVAVYWFTWNAFLHSEEGKHGISRTKPDGEMLRYFQASVRELVKTYPLLAGLGITAGEYMDQKMGALSKEAWLWQAYGEGIRDGLKDQPGRSFRLIHRFHMTGLKEVSDYWTNYPGPFDFSYKYAVAHIYGMTNPPFIKPLLPELSPACRTWLTLRNDDIYSFRWGDPQFARDFIRALPGPEKVAGFYMGPDGYCWGREAMDLEPTSPRQLVMQKQWFSFMLWGRLSYDPNLSDAFFQSVLAARFPEVPAEKLLTGWSAASRIFPELTRFFWGNIDLKWLPEACLSHPRHQGFYTVGHFIEGEGMPESGDLTIREWRERLLANQPMDGITPLTVAANLRHQAETAQRVVAELRPRQGANKELRLTLGDIEAFACLGQYYAAKIEGACELALFDATAQEEHQAAGVAHLEKALEYWRAYASAYTRQYRQPLLYNRVGIVDIPRLVEKAAADVAMAREWKPGRIGKAPPRKNGGSKFGQ